MTKKKQSKKRQAASKAVLQGADKVMRLAHEILVKKLAPAKLNLDETIDVLSIIAKGIVLSNTSEHDLEDSEGMIEYIEERFMAVLEGRDPEDTHGICPHAWLIPPQGLITESIGVMWSGRHTEDSIRVIPLADLEHFRADLAEMKADDVHVHVIEGIEGIAIVDPEWDGEEMVAKCRNPECNATHDVHLTVAENLFKKMKQRDDQRAASN